MTLKRVLIDLLSAEQLREFCTAFDIEADRRSADDMRDGIARAKRAKPEPMIERTTVDQLRSALESYDQPTTGNRPEQLARPLEAGGGYPIASAGSAEPLQVRERATDSSPMTQAKRQAADYLGSHPSVAAWVKNDRLGLVISYRKEGVAKKYLPDFVVELETGDKLLVEIKGQVGDALIKEAAAERWCRAVTNLGRLGVWRYHLCFGQSDLEAVFG